MMFDAILAKLCQPISSAEAEQQPDYHCGFPSSQRIWRRLHVAQPFLDFVWLLRVAPLMIGGIFPEYDTATATVYLEGLICLG